MNDLIKQQILADYKELLSSEAGRRALGSIFYNACLNEPIGPWSGNERTEAYHVGQRDFALRVANTVREVDPMGVAACEVAYQNMIETYIETYERSEDDGRDEWDAGGTD